jgi:predicted Fe-Mo cluster-binding NifX family protein
MKICFPVAKNQGMDSIVFNHFGSAPQFVIVDQAAGSVVTIDNRDMHHEHGACNPVMALNGEQVDAIVVGGIGGGALNKLNQKGIRVYKAQGKTIRENMELISANTLPELTLQQTCAGHAQGQGCSH